MNIHTFFGRYYLRTAAVASLFPICLVANAASSSPGITDTEVVICDSHPLSGPASAYGADTFGSKAYFDQLNANGGVKMADGKTRTVKYIVYDDSYTPQKAVANARRCVQRDQVFAMFGTLGTATNAAIVDYMNEEQVPHVYIATGALWAGDIKKYPWTVPWNLPYVAEGAIYARSIAKENPNARVAVLKASDAFGDEYMEGFKNELEKTTAKLVAVETYDTSSPSVDAEVIKLSNSKADVFFIAGTPKFVSQSLKKKRELNWDAKTYLNSVSASIDSVLKPAGVEASKGAIVAAIFKDPSDPQWQGDDDIKAYRDAVSKTDYDADDLFVLRGYSSAATMTEALRNTAAPTRQALMNAIRNMKYAAPGMLPGIAIQTDKDHIFPLESAKLQSFDGEKWVPFGEVISVDISDLSK